MGVPDSVLNRLNAKLPKLLKVVLHGFKLFGRMAFPIRYFTRNSKGISRAV
jgi:hypothetical protein